MKKIFLTLVLIGVMSTIFTGCSEPVDKEVSQTKAERPSGNGGEGHESKQ